MEGKITVEVFRTSVGEAAPPTGLSPALLALWYAAKGEWDRAHDLTQPGGAELDWVHAYLHRVEGDLDNARYWYRRAGKPASQASLEDEWNMLVHHFLQAAH